MSIEAWLNDRASAIGGALDQRLDNELNDERMPSPQGGDWMQGETFVKTSNDSRGKTKRAGKGDAMAEMPTFVKPVAIGAGAIVIGLIIWKVL